MVLVPTTALLSTAPVVLVPRRAKSRTARRVEDGELRGQYLLIRSAAESVWERASVTLPTDRDGATLLQAEALHLRQTTGTLLESSLGFQQDHLRRRTPVPAWAEVLDMAAKTIDLHLSNIYDYLSTGENVFRQAARKQEEAWRLLDRWLMGG